jgi:hypothetical protein
MLLSCQVVNYKEQFLESNNSLVVACPFDWKKGTWWPVERWIGSSNLSTAPCQQQAQGWGTLDSSLQVSHIRTTAAWLLLRFSYLLRACDPSNLTKWNVFLDVSRFQIQLSFSLPLRYSSCTLGIQYVHRVCNHLRSLSIYLWKTCPVCMPPLGLLPSKYQ